MSRPRASQLAAEVLITDVSNARVPHAVMEVLQAYTAGAAPSGSFGVATTLSIMEALISDTTGNARLSRACIEVLLTDGSESGGGIGTVSYGFAT